MRRLGKPPAHFERISVEPTCSFKLLHTRGNGYQLYLHYHPELELTLIIKGHGMRFVGDSIAEFSDGDLCLVGPDLLHTWYTGPTPQATQAVVIQFDPELLRGLARNYPEFRHAPELIGKAARGLWFTGRSRVRLSELILKAAAAPANSAGRFSTFLEIVDLLHLERLGEPISTAPPRHAQDDPASSRFGKIMSVLHEQMPHPPVQAEMAAFAGMSAAGFSRFFKRLVGRSYVDYVNAWRVSLACRQLLQTPKPITRIAFDCGFANLSNFNRRFQQYKAMSPRKYRRLAQRES